MRETAASTAWRYSSGTSSRSAASSSAMSRYRAACPSTTPAWARICEAHSCDPSEAASNSPSTESATAPKLLPLSSSALERPSADRLSSSTRATACAAPPAAASSMPSISFCAESTSFADSPMSAWDASASEEYRSSTDAVRSI